MLHACSPQKRGRTLRRRLPPLEGGRKLAASVNAHTFICVWCEQRYVLCGLRLCAFELGALSLPNEQTTYTRALITQHHNTYAAAALRRRSYTQYVKPSPPRAISPTRRRRASGATAMRQAVGRRHFQLHRNHRASRTCVSSSCAPVVLCATESPQHPAAHLHLCSAASPAPLESTLRTHSRRSLVCRVLCAVHRITQQHRQQNHLKTTNFPTTNPEEKW